VLLNIFAFLGAHMAANPDQHQDLEQFSRQLHLPSMTGNGIGKRQARGELVMGRLSLMFRPHGTIEPLLLPLILIGFPITSGF